MFFSFLFFNLIHRNGLVVLSDETVVLLLLNDEGISGGGNDEPLENGTLFDDVN